MGNIYSPGDCDRPVTSTSLNSSGPPCVSSCFQSVHLQDIVFGHTSRCRCVLSLSRGSVRTETVAEAVQVHTAPFRLTPVSAETARLRIVHVPDSVPVAGEGLEVMVQASDASGAVLDMPDLKVMAEMGLKSERSAYPLPLLALMAVFSCSAALPRLFVIVKGLLKPSL